MTITASMVKELRQKTGCAMMDCKKALVDSQGDLQAAVELLRIKGMAKAQKRSDKVAAEGKVLAISSGDNKTAFMVEVNCETDFVARDTHFNQFVQRAAELGIKNKAQTLEQTLAISTGEKTLDTERADLVSKIGENIQVRRVALLESQAYVSQYCHGDRIGVIVALNKENNELARDIAMHIAAMSPQTLTPEQVPAAFIEKEREIFLAQAKESGKPQKVLDQIVSNKVKKLLQQTSLVSQSFVKDPSMTVAQLLEKNDVTIEAFVRFEVGEGIDKASENFADEVMAQARGSE